MPASASASYDLLPVPVLELAPDGLALHANRAFGTLTAIDPAQALGVGWLAAVPVDSRKALHEALATRSDFEIALRVLRADGTRAWAEGCARWVPAREAYLFVFQDVTDARLRELGARAESDRFRLLADNVPVAIAYYDRLGHICRYANRLYARTFGLDERAILGLPVERIIGEEAARAIQPHVDQVVSTQTTARYERRLDAPDGRARWIEVHLVPQVAADGTTAGAFVLISDITRHREAEQAIRQSEERLAKFMQASVEGIVFHKDGAITDVNPPLLRLLGYELEDMLGRQTLEFIAEDHRDRVRAVMTAGHEISYESVALHRDGARIPVEFIVRTMMSGEQRLRMTIVRDLRDRLAAQERIHYLAHHDALTGLPNRGAFLERVEATLEQAALAGATLALLFVDIDHFKRVNDSLGHLAGDTLLKVLARRIVGALRASDLVARFAGDEFVVLLSGEQRRTDVEEVAHKLLAAIEQPVEVDGPSISVTPSIGVAMFPEHGRDAAELLKNADTAMYRAKSRGRAQCAFFEPAMAQAAYAALVLESELATALREGQFELHYQPQVRLADRTLSGVEALLRWRHPQRGLLTPRDFIPVAEERRLMLGLGRWALAEALRQALRWRAAGLTDARMGVNLSAIQFEVAGFVEIVEQVLAEQAARGDMLELELTERMLMSDVPAVRRTLERLHAHGIGIAVDDFGTGFTSLGHLRDLAVDRLKIDRSFIRDLPADRGAAAIADAILRMAEGLGLGVVAEGVENEAQLHWLAARGCDEVQGYLIAEPMDAAGVEAWLAARRAVTPSSMPSAAVSSRES